MAVDIDTLQIQIEAVSTDAAQKVNALADVLERLKSVAESGGLSSIANKIRGIGQSAQSAGVESVATSKVRQRTQILNDAAQTVDASAGQQIESTAEKANILRQALDGIRNSASAAFSILKSGASTAKGIIGKLLSTAASTFKTIGSGLKSVGSYIVSKFTKPFASAISTITKWKNALGRVVFYRAVRAAIAAVTDGLKTGIENLYQYSRLVGTEFAPAMNSLATSALYLKNSLGAMAAPLIQAVAPAVDYLVDKFVDLLNIIGKVFAALSGKSTYTQAVKVAKEYAEATNEAADAAKSFLLGIDELNILDNSSGSGSGSAEDYGSMFEEVEVPVETMDWAAQIRQAIEDGDWRGAGSLLAEKLNEVVDGWDSYAWGESLGKKINNALNAAYGFITTFDFEGLGRKVANGLNGIFDGVDWNLLGRTFAAKRNALIDTIYGFVSTFDWGNLGKSISDAVNGWFDEIDWAKAGQTITLGFLGVITTVREFLSNADWMSIGEDIATYLNNIDWIAILAGLGSAISAGIIGALDFAIGFIENIDLGALAQAIGDGIGNLLANIDWGSILTRIGLLIVELVVQIPGIIVGAIGGIADLLAGLFEGFGLDSVAGFFHGIGDAMSDVGTWLKENLVDPVVNWVKNLLGIHSPSTVFAEIGSFLIAGLLNGISSSWSTITDFFGEKINSIKQGLSESWDSIKETASEKWDNIKTTLGTTWDNIKQVASGTWDNIKSTAGDAWENIMINTSTKWGSIQATLSSAWDNVKTTASTKFTKVKTAISGVWSSLVSSAKTRGSDICSNLASGIKKGIGTVSSAVSSVADKIKSLIGFSEPDIGPLSNFHTYMPDMLELMAKGIKDNEYLAVNAVSDLAGSVANAFSEIGTTELQFPVHEDAYVHYGMEFADRQSGMTGSSDDSESFAAGIRSANEEMINVIYAVAQQIVAAVNSNSGDIYLDGVKVGGRTTSVQNRQNRMYGKTLQNT